MGDIVGEDTVVWRSRLEEDVRAQVVVSCQTLVTFRAWNSTIVRRMRGRLS
jgi:hypothetical protein